MTDMAIAVMGVAGRMGQELVRTVTATSGCHVIGGLEPDGAPSVGKDVGAVAGLENLGIAVTSDLPALIAKADAILDFTVPAASVSFARHAADAGIVHVLGTTGLSEEDEAEIRTAATRATVVKAGNMSLGVNLLTELTRKVAAALDEDFDIEVVEMHHRHKVDAPSGTALMLGQAAAEGRKIALKDRSVRVRDGITGERQRGDIGFASLRGGNVAGEHSVIFAADDERIEITHRATDRRIFARGGVKAALWARDKAPGLYSMIDVLGL
ncbi:MAG: 4-hydroxy-tetrahydrodipicolinate reductase [Hyphomicrobiaceae bacterium]